MRLDLASPSPEHAPVSPLWGVWLPVLLALTGLVLAYVAPDYSTEVFMAEGWGPVEMTHVIFPAAMTVIAALALHRAWPASATTLRAWLAALILGGIYIAGEEASWGQHFFNWSTPEYWSSINRQQETNLHNVSSWLNHKPRVALQVAIILTVIVMPIARHYGRFKGFDRRFRLVMPRPDSYFIGRLAIFYMVWDHLSKNAGFPDIATREAELQETFIFGFLLIYAIGLRRRIALALAERGRGVQAAE